MSGVIREDILRGIAAALAAHAPHLLPVIHELLRSGSAEPAAFGMGKPTGGKLTAHIRWEDAEPVTRALEEINSALGDRAVFADRQINFLLLNWRNFSEPKQLPQK